MLSSPNVASKRWVFEQYDSRVRGQTVAGAGSDAAVVRVPGTMRGLALSTDGCGRYGALDPYLGAAHAVAEGARNVAVTGARPLAVTNCLNFGNPERPVVMWQFVESVRGLADACRALGTPVTGGNVSFYNESGESAIWPTPVIGMLGVLEDYRLRVPTGFPRSGLAVYALGETYGELGGGEFAEAVLGLVSATFRRTWRCSASRPRGPWSASRPSARSRSRSSPPSTASPSFDSGRREGRAWCSTASSRRRSTSFARRTSPRSRA